MGKSQKQGTRVTASFSLKDSNELKSKHSYDKEHAESLSDANFHAFLPKSPAYLACPQTHPATMTSTPIAPSVPRGRHLQLHPHPHHYDPSLHSFCKPLPPSLSPSVCEPNHVPHARNPSI